MAAGGISGNGGAADLAAQWGSLCERFHEIRLGAYRHELVDDWRLVAKADPDDPASLTAWQRLDERIWLLDDQELDTAIRHGDGGSVEDDYGTDDDYWDDWGDEYICPVRKCERTVRSPLGLPPRCELFHSEMTRRHAQPPRPPLPGTPSS